MTAEFDAYLASFSEPAGYLNFGSYGPPSRAVVDTMGRLAADAAAGVPSAGLHAEDESALAALARLTGFDRDALVLTSSTSFGLLQIAFGLPRGAVLVSSAEFPSNLYAWWRAQDAGLTTVRTLPAVPGDALAPVTPDRVAAALTPDTVAVAVSAVDFRTGFRADLAGIRAVIGDRLLVVDGIQGFGVLDIDWTVTDALVVGGQKWLRAGWGTGFVALSPRGTERLRPVLGGWTGVENPSRYDGVLHEPLPGAPGLSVTNGSPFASGALATALAQLESVGVATVRRRIEDTVTVFIDRLRAAGVPVLSPVAPRDRAGLVVAGMPGGDAPVVNERLRAAGVSATAHGAGRIRFSVHATTTPAALDAALAVLQER
ncbi:aminotransferase class V-fold PLP-dependent enzyme [Streptomyces xiamenensis]|uniref:aminotransferase class V-fold PLP-dependent enzyme n=1 Tax=Streptomyces xiamenensis TaxID=408015 RepID=UPI003D74FAA7